MCQALYQVRFQPSQSSGSLVEEALVGEGGGAREGVEEGQG